MANMIDIYNNPSRFKEGQKVWVSFLSQNLTLLAVYPSYNRIVCLFQKMDETILVVKILRLRNDDYDLIYRQMKEYHGMLVRSGQSVPNNLQFYQWFDEHLFIQYEDYAGKTVSHEFSRMGVGQIDLSRYRKILKAILRDVISPIFSVEKELNTGYLISGIDPLARNITFVEADPIIRAYLVDLFPPKIFWEGKFTLEKPEPQDEIVRKLSIERSYDIDQILITLWCSLVRAKPAFGLQAIKIISNHLDEIGEGATRNRILKRLNGFANRGIPEQKPEEISVLIDDWGFERVLDLRTLACYLACYKHDNDPRLLTKLEKLFFRSHFQIKPLNANEMAIVKKLVIDIAGMENNSVLFL